MKFVVDDLAIRNNDSLYRQEIRNYSATFPTWLSSYNLNKHVVEPKVNGALISFSITVIESAGRDQ